MNAASCLVHSGADGVWPVPHNTGIRSVRPPHCLHVCHLRTVQCLVFFFNNESKSELLTPTVTLVYMFVNMSSFFNNSD